MPETQRCEFCGHELTAGTFDALERAYNRHLRTVHDYHGE